VYVVRHEYISKQTNVFLAPHADQLFCQCFASVIVEQNGTTAKSGKGYESSRSQSVEMAEQGHGVTIKLRGVVCASDLRTHDKSWATKAKKQ
jgi:hypothetical protein